MSTLSFEKIIVLLNFRNNGIYFKNPIYLRNGYFSYYLSRIEELKFDVDDLFYYSSRKIQKRQGHLFVSDYGMQYSILSRYGIRPYAVAGRDYQFVNGDNSDFRYSNIVIVNRYHGVLQFLKNGLPRYRAVIHINGKKPPLPTTRPLISPARQAFTKIFQKIMSIRSLRRNTQISTPVLKSPGAI